MMMAALSDAGLARVLAGLKSLFASKQTASADTDGLMSAAHYSAVAGLKSGATKQIARGTVSVTVPAASGSTPGQVDATITFPAGTFSDKPCMLASHKNRNRVNDYRIVGYSDNATQGSIRVTTTRTTQESVSIDWIAVN